MNDMEFEKVKEIKDRHVDELMHVKHVVAVGIGSTLIEGEPNDTICIHIYVSVKVPENELLAQDILPKSLEGAPVVVIESGEFRAF